MRTVLITTTINVPYNLRAWRTRLLPDDVVIVAGDVQTPHEDVVRFLGQLDGDNRYLHPDTQRVLWPRTTGVVGDRSVQRRNVALLEAISLRPTFIVTVDDDNWPVGDDSLGIISESLFTETGDLPLVGSSDGWWNVGQLLDPPVWHRGFPHRLRRAGGTGWREESVGGLVGVHAMLWIGAPDVDAVDNLVDELDVTGCGGTVTLAPRTWCPFNSQATAYAWELAPLMMCWPGVGRFDDVWASLLARRVMDETGWLARHGQPVVHHARNQHEPLVDLEAELFGYRYQDEVEVALSTTELRPQTGVVEGMLACYESLERLRWLPDRTREAFRSWVLDVGDAINGTGVGERE